MAKTVFIYLYFDKNKDFFLKEKEKNIIIFTAMLYFSFLKYIFAKFL
jgi:hypothetical protein